MIEAGAVGMNFEDATGDPVHPLADLSLQLEKIQAIREAAVRLDVPLVLNARTDVYLLQVGDPAKRYDEAMHGCRLSAMLVRIAYLFPACGMLRRLAGWLPTCGVR